MHYTDPLLEQQLSPSPKDREFETNPVGSPSWGQPCIIWTRKSVFDRRKFGRTH